MRVARDFGTIEQLLPDGIADLRDCPHHLFTAIRRALLIISFGELPKEERPPRRLWLDDEGLEAWFKDVERKREERYGAGKGPGPIEDPVENPAAKALLVG